MPSLENAESEFIEAARRFWDQIGPGSKTAGGVLAVRFLESSKPEGERVFHDPYAVYFINQDVLKWQAQNPDEVNALMEQYEHFLPGVNNYIIARTILFDDLVKKSVEEGVRQMVILGAGYDTRAYRIDSLRKIKVFEVDYPTTQTFKKETIKKIFGTLPGHVVYVSLDLERNELGQRLLEGGYDPAKRTLFLMEGVLDYLPSAAVDQTISFLARNSCQGSSIIFSYPVQPAVDAGEDTEVTKNISTLVSQLGEPSLFRIREGEIEAFLNRWGLRLVRNLTGEEMQKAYFHGPNIGRRVYNQGHVAQAVVE